MGRRFSIAALGCLLLIDGTAQMGWSAAIADKKISAFIEQRLAHEAKSIAPRVSVSTQDGVVLLSGAVDTLYGRERAEAIAKWTRGVRSVVNRITVRMPAKSAKALQRDIETALRIDPALGAEGIRVAVEDGRVTLSGKVESWPNKQLTIARVQQMRGVRAVRDELEVEPTTQRTDADITTEIQRRLKWDIRVNSGPIDVHTKDGQVTLAGVVRTPWEKKWVERDAAVRGVRSVDSNGLQVQIGDAAPMSKPAPLDKRTDSQVQDAVLEAIRRDSRITHDQLRVQVSESEVVLTGIVTTLAAKQAAEEDARNTIGVWKISNQIGVRRRTILDPRLESQIRDRWLAEPALEDRNLSVDVSQGHATLTGTVDSFFERFRAEELAAQVDGILDLRNQIEIKDPWVGRDDSAIRDNIENDLFFNPRVDLDRIKITVDEAVAILSGDVPSEAAKEEANRAAYESGAKAVINRLTVHPLERANRR